ncbi:MAG: hypothetical protein WD231_03860 [Candidatus Woykebacteria bacterium]
MTSAEDYLILDIGTSWTKAFLVSGVPQGLIKEAIMLPTSQEDIRYSSGTLIKAISSKAKSPRILVTSTFNEAEALAKPLSATFVSKEIVSKELSDWFALQSLVNPTLLDGGASNYLRNFRVSDVGAFLSFRMSEIELENFIGNKALFSQSIPENKNYLEIDEALLRAAFSIYPDLHNPTKFNTVIVTGGLFSWEQKPTRVALLLLDLMAFGKVVQVLQDQRAFLNSYGALISQKKDFKGIDFSILKNLGVLVSLGGAGKVSLDYGLAQIQEVVITENEIALIPVEESQKVNLTIHYKQKVKFSVSGGKWGIILDGRRKPLNLEFGQERSRAQVSSWQQALDNVELFEI